MRRHHPLFIALLLIAALSACTARQDTSRHVKPMQETVLPAPADPMASFSRMIPGEWRATFTSGASHFDS
ncbi:MAG: hypothetical protein H7Y88_12325 [Phycisphaerales bacterium]|nr:hypothetical protein [Phycisphaerales bacterium]